MTTTTHGWAPALDAWAKFVQEHPELGYRPGFWQLHNFLRLHRDALVKHDAIRKARNKFWIANLQSFNSAAFDCATNMSM